MILSTLFLQKNGGHHGLDHWESDVPVTFGKVAILIFKRFTKNQFDMLRMAPGELTFCAQAMTQWPMKGGSFDGI